MHEGLVIEAGDEDGGKQIVDHADIEADRWPGIDAAGGEPVINFDFRCPQIGGGEGAVFKLHQAAGILASGADQPARAVIFEAARDQAHAIGQQRAGQRVPLKGAVAGAVEGEMEGAAAIDQPAFVQACGGVHRSSPPPAGRSGASAGSGGVSP